MDLDQFNFVQQKISFKNDFLSSFSVNSTLAHDQKTDFLRISPLVNQSIKGPVSVVGLQFFLPADVLTHPL